MTKRPSFQFYPADWRKDAELQSCSVTARGLWHEAMCIMHECEPYGELRVNGNPMSAGQLARLVGMSLAECKRALEEIETAGVSSRTADGALYSRRMVRDEATRMVRAASGPLGAEHGIKGAEHGAKGGRPRNATGEKKPPLKPPPSSSSSSSSSSSPSEVRGDDDARATLNRVCEILRVELQANPERVTWLRQVEEMMRDGLDPPRIFAATEIARMHGKLNLAYIRAVAFNPPKPQEKANGQSNRKESQHEQRARIIAEDHGGHAQSRHAIADQSEDYSPRAALPNLTDDGRRSQGLDAGSVRRFGATERR